MFSNNEIDLKILKERAYNLRWATVPDGVIPLTAADPDFPCAPEIADAICAYARSRYLSYGPPDGLPAFKNSMAAYYTGKRKIAASPDHIFPVDSAAFGIYLTCKALLLPGEEAIIFDPVDFLFRYSVEAVGGVAVTLPIPPGDLPVDFAYMESLINAKTRMICLCNPLNPTGKVFTREELTQLGAIACKYNLTILSDEIWSDIVYTPYVYTSIASIDESIAERTVTVTGFSKSYGLAGLRIGSVMASDQALFQRLITASLHNATVHGANVISQVAAVAAIDKCQYWLSEFLLHLQKMRDLCVHELNTIPGFSCIAPQGCYVAFANITGTGMQANEVRDLLFNEAKVAVVPGLKQWFGDGATGYIRISYATSEVLLTEALARIRNTIGKNNSFIL